MQRGVKGVIMATMEHNIAWVNQRLDVHLRAQGVAAQWILWDIGRVIGNALVELTWPREPGSRLPHKSGKWSEAEGQRAVEADVRKLFVPLDEPAIIQWMDEQFGKGATTKGGRVKGAKRQNRIAALLPNAEFNWSGDSGKMVELYQRHRDRNGRVRHKAARVNIGPFEFADKQYIPGPAFRRFVRERQRNVGALKAGFVPALAYFAAMTGGRASIPAYLQSVKQHGTHADAVTPQGDGYIILHDQVPYAERLVNLIIRTAQNRTEAYMEKVTPAQMDKIVQRFNAQRSSPADLRRVA
jgi:hypothetical protein